MKEWMNANIILWFYMKKHIARIVDTLRIKVFLELG